MDASITASQLKIELAGSEPPWLIDVRRTPVFRQAHDMAAGALRRDPDRSREWAAQLPGGSRVVVYCVHGHEVSQSTARQLRELGMAARFLEGGLEEGWKAAGGELIGKPGDGATRWITRERPKIDRVACPWLVRRFVDPDAEFAYVPAAQVLRAAQDSQAVPYDVPNVLFSHEGELCSFDAFLRIFRLAGDPALARLAVIVRGADTARLDLAPQAAGLLAVSLGLSRRYRDDHQMLEQGMVVYDALYAWCREGLAPNEPRSWRLVPV
jgi:rhodanese-related sulfurtransferase